VIYDEIRKRHVNFVIDKRISCSVYIAFKNVLDRIITLETYLEGFGNLRGFFSMNPTS
jgi:hypothetical protein